ncbi:hypothetical protein L1987_42079 [Smallanthus sonchifolius]|uniref:Uncharacterized protein n=1 Tax=Smallanthus sonchifolius TaxID=185202 RepID=A0ACB9GWE7_9ASTR|nr:hypothetical protein L1987_42079 [Smallanthus sonchifolius]
MNFVGGDGGGNNSGRRQQQQQHGGEGGGNSLEEEDEDERQNTGPAGQLFPSPSSSSPSSHHHHHHQHQHQHQHQLPTFPPQPPYHHQISRGGWMHGAEPSSRLADPMMVDYSVNNNNNNNSNSNDDDQQSGGGMMMVVEREHMFDKVVTPSDVGKLNRLVIPKQHAERYFPLDSSTNDKGLLLNFEDRNGKPWRFRYSYWNSSQSYVMTKGWSRFVKDKKLDAGDIVSFQRGVGGSAKDRLFIDWRHRPDAPAPPYHLSSNLSFPLAHNQFSVNRNNIYPWNPLFLQSQPAPSRSHSNLMLQPSSYRYGNTGGPYQNIGIGSVVNVNQGASGSVIYFRSGGGGGIPQQQYVDVIQRHQRNVVGIGMDPSSPPPPPPPPSAVVFESVPVVHGKAAAKRLRLFGVNMDCPISDDDDQEYDPASEMSPTMFSTSTVTNPTSMGNYYHDQFPHHHPPTSSSTIPYLQLRPYEEQTHFNQTTMMSSSSTDAFNKTAKSSSSRKTLDLDI